MPGYALYVCIRCLVLHYGKSHLPRVKLRNALDLDHCNLRNHLRDVHKVDFADAAGGDKPKQGGISSFFKPTKDSLAGSTSCDDRVVKFVCSDLRPVSIVTGDGFLSLVNLFSLVIECHLQRK